MSVTKAKLSEHLISSMGFDKLTATKFVEEFFMQITQALINGQSVKLPGLGNFLIAQKKSRWVRNPKTLKPIWMEERRMVIFKPSKKLKTHIAQEE